MRGIKPDQRGFTLVELIIAMTLFSFMMLILSVGVIQIMRIYQQGVSSRRTQAAARSVVEDIAREVRDTSTIGAVGSNILCVSDGTRIVRYWQDPPTGSLYKKINASSCNDASAGYQVLVAPTTDNNNLKVQQFDTTKITSNNQDASVQVTLAITTGADDLINGSGCVTSTGSEFCATTRFVNTISLRVTN